jgi:hypothetical protein
MEEEFSGGAKEVAPDGPIAGGERRDEVRPPSCPCYPQERVGRHARALARERSPKRVAHLQGRRARAPTREEVKEERAGEGVKGGARQRPSQGGRRGTMAASGWWHEEDFFFLCTRWAATGKGKVGPRWVQGRVRTGWVTKHYVFVRNAPQIAILIVVPPFCHHAT